MTLSAPPPPPPAGITPSPRLGEMFEPPPPPPPASFAPSAQQLAPGQLTSGWRNVLIVGWIGIVLGLAAVWKSSWTLGFPTWWLGPQADPRFPLLLALPFILPIVVVVSAIRNTRYTAFVGIVAALVAENIAWGDVGHQIKFAVVEFALAGAGLAISAASLAGMVRAERHDPDGVAVVAVNTETMEAGRDAAEQLDG